MGSGGEALSHLHKLARHTHSITENTKAAPLRHLVCGEHDCDDVVRVALTKRLRIALDELGILAAETGLIVHMPRAQKHTSAGIRKPEVQ